MVTFEEATTLFREGVINKKTWKKWRNHLEARARAASRRAPVEVDPWDEVIAELDDPTCVAQNTNDTLNLTPF